MSVGHALGFDIGGTFTDFVLLDRAHERIHLHKCLTTADDPSRGALAGLRELVARLGITIADLDHVVHGTTLVTNAIIERRGCRLGLLTTAGFRDILEMGTEQRYDIHDLFLEFPEPMAPRSRRLEITERISCNGEVVTALDREQAREQIDRLLAQGVEAIAVCLLHAYRNPAHEIALRELIRERRPDISVSISSEVHPVVREYERTATTAANAYVQPLMRRYVGKFVDALAGERFTGRFHLIQSSGGLTQPETAMAFPVRFLESGPAGGAQATALLGAMIGRSDMLSFDMGGTTAKACLVQDGLVDTAPMLEAGRVHRFKKGSGIPIHAPVVDMIEIGAGGGSIARVNSLGLLEVGPESAGADPGPACYGRGGRSPTVTDAILLLGYLDPDYFLGGEMTLDREIARTAMERLANELGLPTMETAWGIHDLVCENMAAAARVHIVEKGRDPRRYAMLAMGGAGPLHAVRVARKLGIREVIVPPASGAASALGFLAAPASFTIARSLPQRLDRIDLEAVNALLEGLEAECRGRLRETAGDIEPRVSREAEMRLVGQMHQITVPVAGGVLDATVMEHLVTDFRGRYQEIYTHLYEGAQIEIVDWRVTCSTVPPVPTTRLDSTPRRAGSHGDGVGSESGNAGKTRRAWFAEAGGFVDAVVVDRYSLRAGDRVEGPAIVEERECTTVVPPGDRLSVDEHLDLRIEVAEAKAAEVVVASDTALDEAIATIEADPVGLEIMWRRMINIAEESWHTVIRTAFSLIIGEAQDFACEILDPKGRQIAHSPRAMPVFNLTLPLAVEAMTARFPAQTLEPGDVLVTNDPWACAGHLYDIAVVVPVFRDRRIVAYVGIVGHVSDIGGIKDELSAREIYDEGLQIPPMKLFAAGERNEDLFTIIGENVRRPEQVLGDIHALVAAGRTGAERIVEFMDEYGMHDLEALATVVQARAETAMREAIGALPDGLYESEVEADGIDGVMHYPIQITIDGDEIDVRFEGAPAQTAIGGSNCTLNYTRAHGTYPLKCIFSPEVPGNAGCYRPISVDAPEGSILNCRRPAAVNTRVRTGWYIAPNIFKALAEAAPDKVQAFTGLPSNGLFYGKHADGTVYSDHLFQGGGQGAWSARDGNSALLYPTSAANTSVEIFETRVPALVLKKEFLADSGGAGQKRGGLGQVLLVRKLEEDGLPCQVGLYPNGVMTPIPGLFGGHPGGLAKALVHDGEGGERDLGVGGLAHLENARQTVELRIAGGAGYGDPRTRDYDLIDRDLAENYVTADHASEVYACVIGEDGKVDRSASDRLRDQTTQLE